MSLGNNLAEILEKKYSLKLKKAPQIKHLFKKYILFAEK
jgi:hypothetical protein